MRKTKIVLHGQLEDIATQSFEGYVSNVRDAVRLCEINFPQFAPYLLTAHENGIAFNIRAIDAESSWELSESELYDPTQGREIHIYPSPIGAGRIGKIILGVALLGLAVTGVGVLGLSPLMTGVMGGLMILSGVMGSKPSSPDPDAENTKSFVFNGAVNTVAVGARLPVAYGHSLIVGSYVISANIRTFSITG